MSKNARSIAMGTVISNAFSLFFKAFLNTFPIAIGMGVIELLQWESQRQGTAWSILVLTVGIMLTPLFYGTIYYQTFRMMENKPASTLEAFRAARQRYWVMLFTMIVAFVMLLIGLVLLFIPGLFLFPCFAILVPVVLLGGDGIGGSIKQAITLVWGNWWKVFWLALLSLILTSFFNMPALSLDILFPSMPYGSLIGIISTCLVLPWMAAFGMTLWHQLKLANQRDELMTHQSRGPKMFAQLA